MPRTARALGLLAVAGIAMGCSGDPVGQPDVVHSGGDDVAVTAMNAPDAHGAPLAILDDCATDPAWADKERE